MGQKKKKKRKDIDEFLQIAATSGGHSVCKKLLGENKNNSILLSHKQVTFMSLSEHDSTKERRECARLRLSANLHPLPTVHVAGFHDLPPNPPPTPIFFMSRVPVRTIFPLPSVVSLLQPASVMLSISQGMLSLVSTAQSAYVHPPCEKEKKKSDQGLLNVIVPVFCFYRAFSIDSRMARVNSWLVAWPPMSRVRTLLHE